MTLKTKKKICLMITVLSIMTIIGTVSYAYFTASGEVKEANVSGSTGVMTLRFADNDEGINATLNFGESITKRFTLENTGTVDATVKMNWVELVNTYTNGSLTYTLSYSEKEDGTYTEIVSEKNVPESKSSSKKNLATNIAVPVGKTYYYNLVITLNYLNDVNQDADIDAIFNTKFEVVDISVRNPIEEIIASSNGVRTEFDEPALTDEGVFEMEDDYGTSYYYRGAVTNNYVKFAGFYWRIIRINGDRSLRIIYDGDQAYKNEDSSTARFTHTNQMFNANFKDAKYVGWMYGPTGTTASTSKSQAQTNIESSTLKILLDSWYKTSVVDKGYENLVSDILFCGDRTTPGKEITGWTSDTGLGYGKEATAYGATARASKWNGIVSAPIFKCPQKNDAYTVSDTIKGNGNLVYPIGLITADEVITAGSGKYGTKNDKYYLYRPESWYWSLSPHFMDVNGDAREFIVSINLGYGYVGNKGAVAPVINLTKEYAESMVGTGTMEDPYRSSDENL